MTWVAKDKDGSEWVYNERPNKVNNTEYSPAYRDAYVQLPVGSIQKLIGKELNFEDEPVELKRDE